MASRGGLVICVLALLAFCNAQENQPCQTPNHRPGRCVVVQQCGALMTVLRAPPIPAAALEFMRQSKCGFKDRTPLVCCDENYPDPRNPWLPPVVANPVLLGENNVANHPNLRLLPTADCGKDFTERIFGGNATAINEYPWTALLQYQKGPSKKFLCGGVLINSRYVLTAAHCSSKADLHGYRLISVRLGEHNTETDEDCEVDRINGERICADPVMDVSIEQEFAHPEYEGKKGKSRNEFHDICLLRLSQEVPLDSEYIRAICIPTESTTIAKTYVGESLTVTGWGKTETQSSSNIKLKVAVPVVANSECERIYAAKRRTISSRQLCAGGVGGKDSCNGDSGGPLMSAEKKRFHVTGIVSYGPSPCGGTGWPGVYTRVGEYSKWILDTITP